MGNQMITWSITWPRKVKSRPQYESNIAKTAGECYLATIAIITIVCCDYSTVGYPSDSLASC